jgi:hypothetical protein
MCRLLQHLPRYTVRTTKHAKSTKASSVSYNIKRVTCHKDVPPTHACIQAHQPTRRALHTTVFVSHPGLSLPASCNESLRRRALRNMSSDADYGAFLDKANQDISSAESKNASQKKSYGTKSVNTAVPKVLEQVEEYYVSDSDEPFEPVALEFEGGSVSAGRDPSTLPCTAMTGRANCQMKLTWTQTI